MTSSLGTSTTSGSEPPSLPDRPSTLNSVVNQTASNYSPYGQSRLGTGVGGATSYSGYGGVGGGYGGMNSYSSPYSRFGGMVSSMYGGGYGGMNSMYGGGMGGMYGGAGYGMNGIPGQPGQDPSLTQSFNQSTAATFQIIESIVGAFGGFAQMLESTYMATHSSFFGKSARVPYSVRANHLQPWYQSPNNLATYETPSALSWEYSRSCDGFAPSSQRLPAAHLQPTQPLLHPRTSPPSCQAVTAPSPPLSQTARPPRPNPPRSPS